MVRSMVTNGVGRFIRVRRLALPLALAAASLLVVARAELHAQSVVDTGPRVRSGYVLRPDTVEVGDPFLLVVRVSVPNGARIEWGAIEDTASKVAMRAPVRVQSAEDGPDRVETATYELAAWDVGALDVNMPDATVRIGAQSIPVPITGARVFVRSVLPGDTSLHVPKPPKGMFPRVVPWWQPWWPVGAVLLGLALLWWLYRRRRPHAVRRAVRPLDAYARAIGDFDRLERLALADAGERGRAVTIAVEIMRVYLRERAPAAALSLTSAELMLSLAEDPRIAPEILSSVLAESDAIKFARRAVTTARARELAGAARGVVDQVERAEQQRIADEAARVEATRQQALAQRRIDEDAARRRSRRGKEAA